jgi:hypothetical protein
MNPGLAWPTTVDKLGSGESQKETTQVTGNKRLGQVRNKKTGRGEWSPT